MRINLLLLLILLFCHFNNAQEIVSTDASPSSLGGFNTNQSLVDNSTGAVNYSIPITQLSEGDLIVPISINYYSRGIRVEDMASWVGIGWDLNAGAVITRSVVGYPDDMNNENEGIGILHSTALSDIEALNFDETEDVLSEKVFEFYEDKKDTQPDIFTLNLLGNQVTFLFNKDNEIVFVGNYNLDIDYALDENGEIIRFNLVDENGVNYIFDQYETTTETTTYKRYDGPNVRTDDEKVLVFNSAWHLSLMTYYGKKVIFDYGVDNIEYKVRKPDFGRICKNQDCEAYPSVNWNITPVINSKIEIKSKKIAKITTSNDEVEFLRVGRLDIKGGTRLNYIKITSLIDNKYTYFRLDHGYITSPGQTSDNPYIYKRLQLKSIYEINQKTHEFFYDSTILPNRESSEQDFWGFYNGNEETSLIPKIYTYPESLIKKTSFYPQSEQGAEFIIDGANRNSNLDYAQAGVLKQIKDHLGNNILIDYELNDFQYNNYLFTGNGLRVIEVEIQESGGYSYKKNYSYNLENGSTSGIVDVLPSFSYYHNDRGVRYLPANTSEIVYHEDDEKRYRLFFAQGSGGGTPFPVVEEDGPSNWSVYDKQYYSTIRFSTPLNNNISSNYFTYYTNFTESFLEKKIVYNFEVTNTLLEFPSNPELISNSVKRVRIPEDIDSDEGTNPEVLESNTPGYFDKFYPFFPKLTKSWSNTILKEVSYYKSNELFKKDVYDYQIISKTPIYESVKALKYNFLTKDNLIFFYTDIVTGTYLNHIICFSKYPYLLNTNKYPLSKTTFIYENGIPINEGETQYVYNDLGFIKEEIKIIGDKEYKSIYKYPQDVQSEPYMLDLIDQNRLTEAIVQESYIDSEFIGKTVTEYGVFTNENLILPHKILTYNKENELTNTSVISQYDEKGNPIEMYDEELQVYTSSITAFNNQLVIAEIINARQNEVYHTSFEQENEGGYYSPQYSYTGNKFGRQQFTVPFVKPNNKQYVISYWIMDQNNNWSFSGYLPYTDNMIIETDVFDEVRVHPIDARMTTTTYDKLYKKPLTVTNQRGRVMRYEYDGYGRVKLILDHNRKVLKKYRYNYKN